MEGQSLRAICAADLVLAKPGTAALETAVLGRPLVLAARTHALTAFGLRSMRRMGLFLLDPWELNAPNLIAGFPVVPSFLQEAARPERIAEALAHLLEGPARTLQLERLARVADAVAGSGSVSGEAEARGAGGGRGAPGAAIAAEMIGAHRVAAA